MKKSVIFFLVGILLLSGCGKDLNEQKQEYRIATYTNEYLTDGVVTEEHRAVYTYDDQNQLVQAVGYENGMETSRSFLEYDEYGNELTQERVRDGEVYLRISKTYEPVAQEQ